ncbi:MAG: hypothetical protein LBG08_08425 [Spirochaetaceae bacterium]|jgi:hypothetical protein|nr:hypothetical protein [Spirochaetaceae bacterium]
MRLSAAVALLCTWSLLLPQGLSSQDFSSVGRDLSALEGLILDTLKNSETQMQQLDDLRRNLAESEALIGSYETIITERERLLGDLQIRLNEISEISKRQSALSRKYAENSRFWKTFTLIGLPAAALLGGGLIWMVKSK